MGSVTWRVKNLRKNKKIPHIAVSYFIFTGQAARSIIAAFL
jgi:hypothetical protein